MKTRNNINKLLSIISIIILAASFLSACASDNSSHSESGSTESTSAKVEITKCEYSLGDGVALFWNAYPGADGYNFCRGDSNSADEIIAVIDTVEGQESYSYKDTAFDYSKHDFYCVTAFRRNAAGKAEAIAASRIVSIKSEFGEQGDGEAFDCSTAKVTERSDNSIVIEDANGNVLEERSGVQVAIDPSYFYTTKHLCFYGRAIVGMDPDGNYLLGDWECILDRGSMSETKFTVSGKYVELGFEFDIVNGIDWPYSDVFWHRQDGIAEEVLIDYGGSAKMPWIEIYVNGSSVVRDSNCSAHKRYNWGV